MNIAELRRLEAEAEKVRRYDPGLAGIREDHAAMFACPDGEYVRHADYLAMRNALPEMLKELEEAREALAPFSKYAGPLFERGFMNDDVVTRVSAADGGVVSLTAGDFFHARRSLPPHGGSDVD